MLLEKSGEACSPRFTRTRAPATQLTLPQMAPNSGVPEEGTTAYYEHVAARIVARRRAARHCGASRRPMHDDDLGPLIALPRRQATEPDLSLDLSIGSELPVCVASHQQVKDARIDVKKGGRGRWRLERVATGLLPGPEHYVYWLWFLDRCHAAATMGCEKAPRIIVRPTEICQTLGIDNCDATMNEAFTRFSRVVVETQNDAPKPSTASRAGAFGTLCYYSGESEAANPECVAWAAPGLVLWNNIIKGNVSPLPLKSFKSLRSYIARRLLAYLVQRCGPKQRHTANLATLAEKIPIRGHPSSIARRLAPHHIALQTCGFLSEAPHFRGTGTHRKVTYKRA